MDPEKSNRALGFSALIMGLCQFYRVPITLSKVIRSPINMAFIKKYCIPRKAQGQAPQQPNEDQQPTADVPPPPQEEVPSLRSISNRLQRIELHMHMYMHHVTSQQAANHRGQR